ncbi:MAG: hypothetical protein AB1425_01470 [Actinomycetota bacterium]
MSKKTIERVGDVAAAAGLTASAGFVAWVLRDLEKSFGPSPKKAERERLALTADSWRKSWRAGGGPLNDISRS